MQHNVKKLYLLAPLVLLLALMISLSPVSSTNSLASSFATWTGKTSNWANVRTGPNTGFSLVRMYAPNTNVTVYATVSGQVVWGGISNWYRISSLSSSPLYIYGGLVVATSNPSTGGNTPPPPPPPSTGTGNKGLTTGWANVRNGPSTGNALVTTYAPNTSVTIFSTVSGQMVWGGISTWDRISSPNSAPLFIFGGLVTLASGNNGGGSGATTAQGKLIVVSISKQWMNVYQDGKQVYTSPITTGQPALPTPTGTYHIFVKLSPTTFISPFPVGSPFWYPPTHINYALEWKGGGYFLHDSWWRTVYGPGTNVLHRDPVYGEQTGTHGCVTMPLSAAAWLYNWAAIGTTVQINP